MASYHGESYDGQPLEKADKLLKAILRQFPKQSREHEEYLAKEGAKIRDMMAQRVWSMAKYYEKLGENRSAAFYYQKVSEDFTDTQYAQQAQQVLPQVAALPPKPKQHAKWLSDIFPDAKAIKPLVASGDNESIFR